MRAIFLTLLLLCSDALACGKVTIAYTDKHSPPYFIGNGPTVPQRPGGSVELMMRIAKVAGCKPVFVRVPVPRVRLGLRDGSFDLAPVSGRQEDVAIVSMPVDKAGKIDPKYALAAHAVVFVRARDGLPSDTDPKEYFKTHKLGMAQGLYYSKTLQEQGLDIDNGASTLAQNIEKLHLGRIDGIAVTVIQLDDLDATMRQHGLVRLEQTVRSSHTWLAASKQFQAAHPEAVQKMWDWIAAHASTELRALAKSYP